MNIRTTRIQQTKLPHIAWEPITIKVEKVKQMIMTVGIPACGKSTYIKKHFYDTHMRVNLDMIKQGHKEHTILTSIMSTGINVVIDRTCLTANIRKQFINLALIYEYSIDVYDFEYDIEECIKRDKTRERKVTSHVIIMLAGQYEKPKLSEGITSITTVKFHKTLDIIEDFNISLR